MTAIKSVYDLMVLAAPVLAGRPCVVRLADPVTKTALGCVTVRADGVPVITIRADLGKWTLSSFLHELAHIRLGHVDRMESSNLEQAPAYSYTVSKAERQPSWEDQADALRDQWLAYGKKHADPSYTQDAGILLALIDKYRED